MYQYLTYFVKKIPQTVTKAINAVIPLSVREFASESVRQVQGVINNIYSPVTLPSATKALLKQSLYTNAVYASFCILDEIIRRNDLAAVEGYAGSEIAAYYSNIMKISLFLTWHNWVRMKLDNIIYSVAITNSISRKPQDITESRREMERQHNLHTNDDKLRSSKRRVADALSVIDYNIDLNIIYALSLVLNLLKPLVPGISSMGNDIILPILEAKTHGAGLIDYQLSELEMDAEQRRKILLDNFACMVTWGALFMLSLNMTSNIFKSVSGLENNQIDKAFGNFLNHLFIAHILLMRQSLSGRLKGIDIFYLNYSIANTLVNHTVIPATTFLKEKYTQSILSQAWGYIKKNILRVKPKKKMYLEFFLEQIIKHNWKRDIKLARWLFSPLLFRDLFLVDFFVKRPAIHLLLNNHEMMLREIVGTTDPIRKDWIANFGAKVFTMIPLNWRGLSFLVADEIKIKQLIANLIVRKKLDDPIDAIKLLLAARDVYCKEIGQQEIQIKNMTPVEDLSLLIHADFADNPEKQQISPAKYEKKPLNELVQDNYAVVQDRDEMYFNPELFEEERAGVESDFCIIDAYSDGNPALLFSDASQRRASPQLELQSRRERRWALH